MKVLVCEDDFGIRRGLVDVLQNEGYQVLEAASGEEALTLFDREAPQFVCLDIMMPGRSGYDVCREMKARNRCVSIMFVSAKSEEVDRVVGLELGADDYMVKPFGVKELVSRIRAITRRLIPSSGTASGDFVFGALCVKPHELRAVSGRKVIDLSLRDVKLLTLLASEPGRVVDRDTIFDRCWGMNYLPNSRTLDQQVSKLRKKIGQRADSQSPIETVHGVGYRYSPPN
ncbi:MAG: response regulator transcription factor [Bdellovibrionota bacterium]